MIPSETAHNLGRKVWSVLKYATYILLCSEFLIAVVRKHLLSGN